MKKLHSLAAVSLIGILYVIHVLRPTVRADDEHYYSNGDISTSEGISLADIFSNNEILEQNEIGSKNCFEFSKCNTREHMCSCDDLCGVLNGCCPHADNEMTLDMSLDQFACSNVDGFGTVMLLSKCAADWENSATKLLCEHCSRLEDTFSWVPVSHKTVKGLVYKNMYCALCNNVQDYRYWKAILECYTSDRTNASINNPDCQLSFDRPDEYNSYRDCSFNFTDIISYCPADYNTTGIKQKCEQGSSLLVFAEDFSLKFKNKFCALCNGHTEMSVLSGRAAVKYLYSYRMLVDFNEKRFEETRLGGTQTLETSNQLQFNNCNDAQMYDPLSGFCRGILCPNNTQPSRGKCTPKPSLLDPHFNAENGSVVAAQCTLSKVNPGEFEYRKDTMQIVFRQRIYNDTEYIRNGSDIFMCINISGSVSHGRQLSPSDDYEQIMSFVGLTISVVLLSITIGVYLKFPELLNIPGKNLVCLCISLMLSQLLFLLSPFASGTVVVCEVMAVLMHYFFLADFCWTNVIAYDIFMTFSKTRRVSNGHYQSSKKFYIYSIYSWCIPLVIVVVALLLDFTVSDETLAAFQPHYGQGACWISSRNALLLFFVGPLAMFKLFDLTMFGFIVYVITKAKTQGVMATNKGKYSTFLIHLRISFAMGLTWAFAFIANFSGNTIVWYFFIICNTLQGLFISASFLCTKTVYKLLKARQTSSNSYNISRPDNTVSLSLSHIEQSKTC